jgi:hypothetical protein
VIQTDQLCVCTVFKFESFLASSERLTSKMITYKSKHRPQKKKKILVPHKLVKEVFNSKYITNLSSVSKVMVQKRLMLFLDPEKLCGSLSQIHGSKTL